MKRLLIFEQLEERIAPTVVDAGESFSFTDSDGTEVTIACIGPLGSYVNVTDDGGGNMNNNDDIGWITAVGNDFSSAVIVTGVGGDGEFAITKGFRSEGVGLDFGLVSLGIGSGGETAGTVVLSTDAQVTVDGRLGGVVLNGDINFDTGGHKITASGDIGLVDVYGDMTLSPVDGAYIHPGLAYGTSDVSFVTVGGLIFVEDGGDELTPEVLTSGASHSFDDDYGVTGDSGYLTVKVTGGAADIYAIPMVDGGSVIADIVLSSGASVAVTAFGTGGDVSAVSSAGAIGSVTLSGVADTDLYIVAGANVGSVTNNASYGDIVSVISDGAINSVTTKTTGTFGTMLTDVGHAYPMLGSSSAFLGWHTSAVSIGSIKAGAIADTTIEASASISSVSATPGGIADADITAGAGIGAVQAAYLRDSYVFAETGIASIKTGGAGITDSEIASHGNITLIQTPGAITSTVISNKYEVLDMLAGGSIGTVKAGSLVGSDLEAAYGFGLVKVTGQISQSTIDSEFTDLSGTVGGAITTLSAGGISAQSEIQAISIGTLSVGLGGIADNDTIIDAHTQIAKVAVKGDVTRYAEITAGGGITAVTIGGDLSYGAKVNSDGFLTSMTVNGEMLWGTAVTVAGNVASMNVKGGITGYSTVVDIGGNCGSFAAGSLSGEDQVDVGEDSRTCAVLIHGDAGRVSIKGGISSAVLGVEGNAGSVSVGGSVTKGVLAVEGNLTILSVKGDMNHSALALGADGSPATIGTVSIAGGLAGCNNDYAVDIVGNVGNFAVKGGMVATQLSVDGAVTSMSFGKGVYFSALGISGATGALTVGTAVDNANLLFFEGIGSCTVKGSILNSEIGTTHYDGDGNPLGGRIDKLTAQDISGSSIYAFGGIGVLTSKGDITNSYIEAVGRNEADKDDREVDSVVGGGAIASIIAKGLNGTDVLAYTDVALVTLGDGGVSAGSAIEAMTGNFGSLKTTGIISGDILVDGNVTGSILSAGANAVAIDSAADYYFLDASGLLTGGKLIVGGTIVGPVS